MPYWASSQPIEQVWAYIKNYVALRWFVGRRHHQVRSQLIYGLYGRTRAGDIANCWSEPAGLKAREHGITPELAQKFIAKSLKAVNRYVSDRMPGVGPVGTWTQAQIDGLVLPVAGGMNEDEMQEEEVTGVVDNDMIDEIDV